MLTADGANILLGLVAVVAIVSTLWSMGCLLWVTRRPRSVADHTPPVTIFKPLKGLDEGLEENLRSFFHLDYPVYQLIFGVADARRPGHRGRPGLAGRVSRPGREAGRGEPGVRAQPEGREPGGDGAATASTT